MNSHKDTELSEEEDLYDEDSREQLVEDDEISSSEAAFMKGYGEAI